MNKKIVAINSSRRKGTTYKVLERIAVILQQEAMDVEIINLFDYSLEPCLGCMKCVEGKNCVLSKKDDMDLLMQKLVACDGIILSSPVYMRQISGKLKQFVDRTCVWYHRSSIYGKPFFAVATTGGSGLKPTLSYLEDVGKQWGDLPCGKIGLKIYDTDREITPKELEKFIKTIKAGSATYKPSLKQVMDYQVQKVLALKILPTDKDYWEAKSWDKQDFFIKCSINPVKKVIGKGYYKFLATVIRPKEEK